MLIILFDNIYWLFPPSILLLLIYYYTSKWCKVADTGRTPLLIHYISRDQAIAHELTIASTLPAVARCSLKQVAQVVLNHSCVTNWHKRKFSQDVIYRDDIKNWLSVVKLEKNLGSNRLLKQKNRFNIHNTYNTHNTYNNYFQDSRMFPLSTQVHRRRTGTSVCFSRGWEQKQYLSIPNCFQQHNKCSIVDSLRSNHDRIQSVIAVKRFCRKQVQ